MSKLQIMSDIHSEFLGNDGIRLMPKVHPDADFVLIAGDFSNIHKAEVFKTWVKSRPHKMFIAVPGNHDYWKTDFDYEKLRDFYSDLLNFRLLNNNCFEVDEFEIFGSTLWTEFTNPLAEIDSFRFIADYRLIHNFTVKDWMSANEVSKNILKDFLKKKSDKPKIVLTHHSPSLLSQHPMYADEKSWIWQSYHNRYESLIEDFGPLYWIHGHTHDNVDYMIGNTRVLANQFGYPTCRENPFFNPDFLIEV